MAAIICKGCGTAGDGGKTVTDGSFAVEIVLWLFFLVPGFIYSIWRLTTRHQACGKCGSKELIPLDSPIGKQLVAARIAAGIVDEPPKEPEAGPNDYY